MMTVLGVLASAILILVLIGKARRRWISSTGTRGPVGRWRVRLALAAEPDELPLVEPELRAPRPRPPASYFSLVPETEEPEVENHRDPYPERTRARRHFYHWCRRRRRLLQGLQRDSTAATAWCVRIWGRPMRRDPRDEYWELHTAEKLRCTYAFHDEDGDIVLGHLDVMKLLELEPGYGEYPPNGPFPLHEWVARAIQVGSTFTVLFPSGRPKEHQIYAALEPCLRRSLVEVLRDARDDDAERLERAVAAIVGRPWPETEDGEGHAVPYRDSTGLEAYFEILSRIAGTEVSPERPVMEVIEALNSVYRKLLAGEVDAPTVERLGAICDAVPGDIWAAR
jgi:hypothetical protein